ncbi:outer membrane beta-barrel protein [Chondrinema litorale]|uniref:outer membrane beta-barrel protein n=1 Tax=Chondrinema litorale TaxID=2994555 RepID=UPI002542F57B|nr:outer membrane beta-barrel protein [Chondrinema litorale]UZR93048.1 outer membrane beta-barrel protein [Chondrinema litorale]
MKYFLLVFSFISIVQVSQAQLLKFGLRGGASSTNLSADDLLITSSSDFDELKVKVGDSKVGVHAGIFARINVPVLPIYIQPELLFSSVGGEYEVSSVVDGTAETSIKDVKFSRLDIPALVGAKLGPLRVNAGPVFTFILNENNGFSDAIKEAAGLPDSDQDTKGATVGYQAGIGLDLWKLAFDLKYEGDLSKLGDGVTIGGSQYNFDTRSSQVLLSVGYFF